MIATTHRHVFKQTGKQADTHTRIQADRQTDRQKRRTSAKLLNAEHRRNYNRYRVLRRRPDAKYGLLLNVVIPSSKRAKVCTTVYYVTAVEYSSMLVRTYTMYLQQRCWILSKDRGTFGETKLMGWAYRTWNLHMLRLCGLCRSKIRLGHAKTRIRGSKWRPIQCMNNAESQPHKNFQLNILLDAYTLLWNDLSTEEWDDQSNNTEYLIRINYCAITLIIL